MLHRSESFQAGLLEAVVRLTQVQGQGYVIGVIVRGRHR